MVRDGEIVEDVTFQGENRKDTLLFIRGEEARFLSVVDFKMLPFPRQMKDYGRGI